MTACSRDNGVPHEPQLFEELRLEPWPSNACEVAGARTAKLAVRARRVKSFFMMSGDPDLLVAVFLRREHETRV